MLPLFPTRNRREPDHRGPYRQHASRRRPSRPRLRAHRRRAAPWPVRQRRTRRVRTWATRRLRHVGPPRDGGRRLLQRRARRCDLAGGRRAPPGARRDGPARARRRHARAVAAGLPHGARGLRGERGPPRDRRRPRAGLDPDRVAHDPGAQRWTRRRDGWPAPGRGVGRRRRDHALAQPAQGRRLQVQPAARRPRRHRRHARDRGSRERPARLRWAWDTEDLVRARARSRRHGAARPPRSLRP